MKKRNTGAETLIPTIRLNWEKHIDGFKTDPQRPNVLVPQSRRTEPLLYVAAELEDPVVLHFINCKTPENYITFLDRFGPLDRSDQQDLKTLTMQAYLFSYAVLFRAGKNLAPPERVHALNDVMTHISLRPIFLNPGLGGHGQLVLEADTLGDFMAMEVAAVIEAGAVATTCEHCKKAFLTGPRTGRRSHAKYCSDRCRVYAMRARNAAKEG